jgi:hypothetical protein
MIRHLHMRLQYRGVSLLLGAASSSDAKFLVSPTYSAYCFISFEVTALYALRGY